MEFRSFLCQLDQFEEKYKKRLNPKLTDVPWQQNWLNNNFTEGKYFEMSQKFSLYLKMKNSWNSGVPQGIVCGPTWLQHICTENTLYALTIKLSCKAMLSFYIRHMEKHRNDIFCMKNDKKLLLKRLELRHLIHNIFSLIP